MTLLERAELLGARISKVRLEGYAIYRVKCSMCHGPGPGLPPGSSNWSGKDIRKAMNDHAREHLEE